MQQFSSTANNFTSISKASGFTQQNVQYNDFILFFPLGFEKIFLTLYIVFLPYLTGLLFLLLYVSKGDVMVFSSLNNESSFLFSWCIGYECLAILALLLIVKKAFSFHSSKKHF